MEKMDECIQELDLEFRMVKCRFHMCIACTISDAVNSDESPEKWGRKSTRVLERADNSHCIVVDEFSVPSQNPKTHRISLSSAEIVWHEKF